MKRKATEEHTLIEENKKLKNRLEEAEETLRAIRDGEIDALVVQGQKGHQIYTLKGAEHTYRVLIESMNEGAVTLDNQGTILYCNNNFSKIIDVPLETIIGNSILSYINIKDRKQFSLLLKKTLNNKKVSQESTFRHASKKYIPVLLSASPMHFDSGDIGTSLIITDLTEQKRIEELSASEKLSEQRLIHETELRNAAEGAARALQAERNNLQKEIVERKKLEKQKDEFLGMASHELKTPVTSIKAYAQVLQLKFKRENNEKARELLAKMDAQLGKLTNLISDLLDITKIEGDKLKFHENYFDCDDLITEIIEELQRTTEKHTIKKELEYSKTLWGDRERIGQVLTNFLSNAIKYSPHSDKIIVKSKKDKYSVTISVQDFGVGIPNDAQKRIFERFFRVSGHTQETYPGLGLGLYISSEIIKRHNGYMTVESEPGKGSIFSFTVPLYKKAKK